MERKIYRRLQRHLDRRAVGFPAAWSGADIRLLNRLFTPDEARVALDLSCKPTAEVSFAACSQCGTCVSRCQFGAVTLAVRSGETKIEPSRCIGCGLRVPTCPPDSNPPVAFTDLKRSTLKLLNFQQTRLRNARPALCLE